MSKKKKKKILKQPGEEKMVRVHSSAYGDHLRAARGSKKPATINSVLTANAAHTRPIIKIASEVNNALKLYADLFKEGMFWQAMLSRFLKANTDNPALLFKSLEDLELNSNYPLERFAYIPEICSDFIKGGLHVSLLCESAPYFKKNKDTQYCYEVIALFFTGKGKLAGHGMVSSKWFDKKEAAGELNFDFKKPKTAQLYVLCLRLHTGVNNIATDYLSTQGMQIVLTT